MPEDDTIPPNGGRPDGRAGLTSPPVTGIRPITAVTTGTRIVGTYEIEMLINTGGMGEVYRGRNIHDGQPVAIKIILPHLAQDEMIVQMFQKEARVLNRLVHDAVVRYYMFTSDPDIGRPCIVMEFVEGTSLNAVMKEGPMALEDVRVLLRRLAGGLDKAHTLGIIHRDLSPDNVLLEHGIVGEAKIIDFGIAKSTMKGEATLLQGQFAGKFSYVAPEQLGAYGGNVDGRADIYSLALMMVAVAQGRALNMGKSIVEAVRARSAVPDLSGVYPEIRPLLEHMLQPDPAHRPATMADVIRLVDDPTLVPEGPGEDTEYDDPDRTRILRVTPQAGTAPPAAGPSRTKTPRPDPAGQDALFLGIPGEKTVEKPVAKKSKAGLVVVILAVLGLAGAAGAWVAGVFDKPIVVSGTPTPPEPTPPVTPEPTPPEPTPPVTPEPTPPEPTPPVTPEPTPPEPTPPVTPEPTPPEPTPPVTPEPTPPEPTPPEPTPPVTPEPPADPVGRQLAWLAGFDAGPCTLIAGARSGDRVAIEGYGSSVAPLTGLLSAFTAEHGTEPDITVRIVNEAQCPVIDYARSLQSGATLPATVILDNPRDTVRSGEIVQGRIEGLAGRAVSLFLVNGLGGATNLKPFLVTSANGVTTFSFSVNLAPGTPPTPQILMAVITDQPLTRLDVVPNGVSAMALVPFMSTEMTRARQQPAVALRFFRLEN